jgi:hypothetical protein
MKKLRRKDLRGLDSPKWREVIASIGIDVIPFMIDRQFPETIICTNCSGTKGVNIAQGIPKEFYLGKPQMRFYAFDPVRNFV